MEFDRESLRGIYDALPVSDRDIIARACYRRKVKVDYANIVTDEYLYVVVEVMVELGYIKTYDIPASELAAEEYLEILASQDLMTDRG
jgi:hypothetical protein